MKYNPLIHHRRSIRLKGYDYSQAGLYFITLCCHNKESLFGKIINGEMELSDAGKIAGNEWVNTLKLRSNVELDEFVIMPNHMHGIIIINDNGRAVLHTADDTAPNDNVDPNEIMPSNEIMGNSSSNKSGDIVGDDGRAVFHTADDTAPNDNTTQNEIMPSNEIMGNLSTIKSGYANTKGIYKKPLQSPSQTVGAIIRGYKSSVTKQINILPFNSNDEYNKMGVLNNPSKGVINSSSQGVFNTPQLASNKIIWQANYYETIIRNNIAYQNISDYIKNNPSKWDGDKFYYHLNK